MLQQTQAPRVVAPYERWITQFPDPPSCARAGPAAALGAWAGLGYNRRALRLHRAAVAITECHGGRVPDRLAALEALPGVGPYTARAVMAFAFGADVGVVDTNVARVLSRAVAGRRLGPKEAQSLADRLVPARQSWAYNQTLFDIGATVCRSRRPDCPGCPLRGLCAWDGSGRCEPDPAELGRRQSRFEGSDRQGRGRLMDALRLGPLRPDELAGAAGWPEDPERAVRVATTLVADGLAAWGARAVLALP
ncbi:MAG: A/G-specific adenine glycosylase [Acidimicrobiales bacterium]